MVRLEKINLCLRELFEKKTWVSVSVSESTGIGVILWRQLAGCIRHMPVLRFRTIMT